MMSFARAIITCLTILYLGCGSASAHQVALSYINVSRDAEGATATVIVPLLDLEVAVGVDGNLDGKVTWGEVKASLDRITSYVTARTSVSAGSACTLTRQSAAPVVQNGETYLSIDFDVACPTAAGIAEVRSSIFQEVDPTSRILVSLRNEGIGSSYVLGAGDTPQRVEQGMASVAPAPVKHDTSLASYFQEGVSH
ncbi:MAG: hypothetical protein EON93_05045, partial [Burkholderiales bacterium]